MTVSHVERHPPKHNSIQWTGDNFDEVQQKLNTNIFMITQNFSGKLIVRDKFSGANAASVVVGSWIVSEPYYGPITDEFGFILSVFTDEEYNEEFIIPAV